MFRRGKDQLNLRALILFLCVFSVAITLLNAFYSIYRVQRDLIISNTIESNRVYAEKMAEMTDAFINTSMSQLKYSADLLSNSMADLAAISSEVDRLKKQTDSFNSVVVVNADGVVVSISPEIAQVKGLKLTQEGALQSLRAKRPLITDPFISPAGNYLTSISYPIFSDSREYLGYVSGTIYLEERNVLTTLLGNHAYQDGSYLYVVDRNRTVIYHPDKNKIMVDNEAISAVISGESGGVDFINSNGIPMLAGYAPVSASGWGIVAQRPKALTLLALEEQMWKVFLKSIPISLLTLLLIWISALFISRPLWQLASTVRGFENHTETIAELGLIKPWYFEAAHLKRSFLKAFGIVSSTIDKLHSDSLTDAMTGLLNRRGLEMAIESFSDHNIPFAVLALDLDYFKRVNDTFGHDIGDKLLCEVATLMKEQAREHDIVCRSGGEEFIIFLANTGMNRAYDVAERIRKSLAAHYFPTIGNMTISIGVSHWLGNSQSIETVIKNADNALYQAKNNGRNRTEMARS
ncbi:sensor domain-containing diguanylate cyclase [Vibrio sp. CAU 1672]|uniref:sensor domain-containing diguanylate cyclase n=1 Tax=Vibrio sp. CAU 1672 TaxID=3032594 RepID=UPI0023D9F107|nr:sensor domain-containing diguanylate cyclase [Vibrio sp. CAU 1672]MDF2155390.1 sensor domain-containing diguanylate cyclase [Vibrio sp. CAU 1672]